MPGKRYRDRRGWTVGTATWIHPSGRQLYYISRWRDAGEVVDGRADYPSFEAGQRELDRRAEQYGWREVEGEE